MRHDRREPRVTAAQQALPTAAEPPPVISAALLRRKMLRRRAAAVRSEQQPAGGIEVRATHTTEEALPADVRDRYDSGFADAALYLAAERDPEAFARRVLARLAERHERVHASVLAFCRIQLARQLGPARARALSLGSVREKFVAILVGQFGAAARATVRAASNVAVDSVPGGAIADVLRGDGDARHAADLQGAMDALLGHLSASLAAAQRETTAYVSRCVAEPVQLARFLSQIERSPIDPEVVESMLEAELQASLTAAGRTVNETLDAYAADRSTLGHEMDEANTALEIP